MPDPVLGKDFELYVLDTAQSPDAYVLVDGINQWDDQINRERQSWPMFGRATDYQTVGSREITYSMGGFLILTDPGQVIIRTAELADSTVGIKVLWEGGSDGYTQNVRIGTRSGSRTPEGLQTLTYEVAAIDDAVIVGSGPLP